MSQNTKSLRILIAKEFSETPGPRYILQGPFSGEAFRKKHLKPAFKSADRVTVVLDGTSGFGSSFIDEAFGGLVRSEGFRSDDILRRLEIVSEDDPLLEGDAIESIKEAKPQHG